MPNPILRQADPKESNRNRVNLVDPTVAVAEVAVRVAGDQEAVKIVDRAALVVLAAPRVALA